MSVPFNIVWKLIQPWGPSNSRPLVDTATHDDTTSDISVVSQDSSMESTIEEEPRQATSLVELPSEILDQIMGLLDCPTLVSLHRTCRRLSECSTNDLLWASLVRANVPFPLDNPAPFGSWRALYMSHHPYWFLPRNIIWFSDVAHTGKLILARYDPRTGCIEAYRLVAEHGGHTFHQWNWNQDVIIHTFRPKVFFTAPNLWPNNLLTVSVTGSAMAG